MISKASKNHHFVPECYLKNFIINKDLYIVDVSKVKIGHQKKLRMAQPANVCYLENYYKINQLSDFDQFLLNAFENLHVEREVLRRLEGKYSSLYKRITNDKKLNDKQAIDLSDFIIFMKLRNPYWLNDTLEPNKIKWIESAISDAYEQSFEHPIFKKMPNNLKEFLVQDIINKNITDLNFSKKLQLYSLIQRDKTPNDNRKFRESIINCEWILLESPKYGPYFITSDNPGFSIGSDNLLYNTRFQDGFIFYLPLSFKYCLLFSDNLKDFSFTKRNEKLINRINADGNTVIQINDKTIQRINKLLIGGDDWYLNHIIKNNSPK